MVQISSNEIQSFEREHLAKLRALAPECMVLLRKDGFFPLAKPCDIALYGNGARGTIKGGTGSGGVNVRHYTTVEEGLENAGFNITSKAWLDKQPTPDTQVTPDLKNMPNLDSTKMLDAAGECCLYVIARNSGEGADRTSTAGDLMLTEEEIGDILHCAEHYKKFMLVLNVGGPVDISPVLDSVQNILVLSQLGTVTGDALADVLLGKAYPSGKLTTTWAKAKDYCKIGDFGEIDDTRYLEDIFVGYRYFDAVNVKPLFPFGFGLGYTDFTIKTDSFEVKDNMVNVQVTVSNIGSFAGKEVVQLYYSAPQGKLVKPLRELGAYEKTKELLPGESQSLTVKLNLDNMASWDTENDAWLLEAGSYIISINDSPVGVIRLDFDVQTQKLSHCFPNWNLVPWKPDTTVAPSAAEDANVSSNLPVVHVNAERLKNIGHYERGRVNAPKLELPCVKDFTDKELATICVGKHGDGQGLSAILGGADDKLAGQAGQTSTLVEEKGYGALVMADGPAGLRVATKYVMTEVGQDIVDADAFESILGLLPASIRQIVVRALEQKAEKAKSSTVYYHYASAIPIGTALAQSWNSEVQESCGDIVAEEMQLFGANVWLAPALNIHRSVLCGRNFEYFSEDPVISGQSAAAVTRGVQRHDKCAVTIKHFACNNQETNRYGSNSVVSQRALREIYLKGFEICIKQAAPALLMTSYNLINGTHSANLHELLTDILRNQWDYRGMVMTDWSTTSGQFNAGKNGPSDPALCIHAGNDLIMPGSTSDVSAILTALDSGKLSRSDLEVCAARILATSKLLS